MTPSGGASTTESFMPSCRSALRPASMYTEPSLTYFTRNTVGLLLACPVGLAGGEMAPSGDCAWIRAGKETRRKLKRKGSTHRRGNTLRDNRAVLPIQPNTSLCPPVIPPSVRQCLVLYSGRVRFPVS